MSRTLIFVRTTLGWEDVGVVRDHIRHMRTVLEAVPGFQGAAAWKGVSDVYARLILYAYEDAAAADRGFASLEDVQTLAERVGDSSAPVDVVRLHVECSDGAFAKGIPDDAMIAAIVRVAEPGYGPDAVDDLEAEFGGLMMVEGYAGMAIGTRQDMADEVVGLTAWRTAEGLAASLHEAGTDVVALYEPLGEA